MKTKWYENVGQSRDDNYICSRIRLTRNWEEYAFPNRLDMRQAGELVGRLMDGIGSIEALAGENFTMNTLDRYSEIERLAMKERRVMNAQAAEARVPAGLVLSKTEDVSILLNGDDHIRLQVLAPGLDIDSIFKRADKLDDAVNSRFNYAYDEKYGYLTSYPVNVGTGMRANVVLHLPTLAKTDENRNYIDALGKFGVTIRGVFGQGRENYGALYDISNTKTLGMNEREIVGLVKRIAAQLDEKETQQRRSGLEKHYLMKQDEAFRAYGILKYARTMKLQSALMFLSQIRTGIADGLIETENETGIYELMLRIQPGNLLLGADRPLDRDELDAVRADFLRTHLPKIKEA